MENWLKKEIEAVEAQHNALIEEINKVQNLPSSVTRALGSLKRTIDAWKSEREAVNLSGRLILPKVQYSDPGRK